mmetsp:Transcript_4510/g.8227  ORF Transcript_4510/g.8227 Transcript_4510/m.8227 type:complete len:218 (-) Transcript_4510:295-948(-)
MLPLFQRLLSHGHIRPYGKLLQLLSQSLLHLLVDVGLGALGFGPGRPDLHGEPVLFLVKFMHGGVVVQLPFLLLPRATQPFLEVLEVFFSCRDVSNCCWRSKLMFGSELQFLAPLARPVILKEGRHSVSVEVAPPKIPLLMLRCLGAMDLRICQLEGEQGFSILSPLFANTLEVYDHELTVTPVEGEVRESLRNRAVSSELVVIHVAVIVVELHPVA